MEVFQIFRVATYIHRNSFENHLNENRWVHIISTEML